jgi:hypothetical protein
MKNVLLALLAVCFASAHAVELDSAAKRYRVSFDTPSHGWPLNEPFSLPLQLSSRNGPGLPNDLSIDVDASMPAHRHGAALVPLVRRTGPQQFRVDGLLFHMSGAWRIKLTLTSGSLVDEVVLHAHVD